MRLVLFFLLGIFLIAGCASDSETPGVNSITNDPAAAAGAASQNGGEPSQITVQHILIGFKGSLEGKPISRSKEEAQALAEELLAKAKSGADFGELVAAHTDDSPPGIYKMANYGHPGNMRTRDQSKMIFERGGMVPAFGNVGFKLEVGEIGMSQYGEDSPFGWHIIKRLN